MKKTSTVRVNRNMIFKGHKLTIGLDLEVPKRTHRLVSRISLLTRTDGCRRNLELRKLIREETILRKLRNEFSKLSTCYFWLLLAQSRHRQQYLRKRPKVTAMTGGDLELLNPYFRVAMDSSEAEEKLLDSRQTPNDVIRCAQ